MWILPTYGRPERCQEALDCLTKSGIATPGIVVVNGDPDPRYRALRLPPGWQVEFRADNGRVLTPLREHFERCPNEPWYGCLADDTFVRSGPGWDLRLIEKAGPFGIASPDDGWQEGKRWTWGSVTGGELVRTVGWWYPPELYGLFADDIWEIIGRALNLWRYVPQVLVEHAHPFNGKAAPDATHELSYEAEAWQHDRAIFERLKATEIPAAIARLRERLGMSEEAEAARDARMRSRSLLIATPILGRPTWQYTKALSETHRLLWELGIRNRGQFTVGSSNLPRARNELVAHFLDDTDFTDLLFVDSDMGWEAGAVARVLASDKEIVAGVGLKKSPATYDNPEAWCFRMLPDRQLPQDDFGMVEVERVGTGFIKISREALEHIRANGPRELDIEKYYRFFRFNDWDGGEDYEFCRLAKACGLKIWIDPTIELVHVGDYEWRGRIGDLMSVKLPAAADDAGEVETREAAE